MSKFNIPAITQPIDLAEYNQALAGGIVHVWVNPTREHRGQLVEFQVESNRVVRLLDAMNQADTPEAERTGKANEMLDGIKASSQRIYEWYAVTWSKNSETWTAAECEDIHKTDPALWEWLQNRTHALMDEFRQATRKN
jgi:hypothetical protein